MSEWGSRDFGRGPRHHNRVGFGVSQATRLPRFQLNNGLLRQIYFIAAVLGKIATTEYISDFTTSFPLKSVDAPACYL